MMFHVQGRFIGENGSMGYMQGREYALEISFAYWGHRVSVVPVHGYEYRTIEDMRCPYDNMLMLLQNWQILKVINGPYNWRRDREDYLSKQ